MDVGLLLAALLGAVLLHSNSLAGAQQSQCPPLPDITNGFVTYAPDTTPNYDLDTVATYVCHSGFVLDLSLGGSEMRTCVDGIWNNLEPSCINAPSVLCFAAVDSSCGGRFLGGNDSQSCCLPPEAQGLGGGGYLVNGFGDCISCTVGLVVTFDPPVYMVEEGGVVNLRVVVSGEADVSISVQFTTEEDSASNDDFVPIQTTLTLNPGITVLMVAVETVGDELAEGDEILIGRLTSEHPLITLGVSQATIIILDDDAVCSEVPSLDNGLVSYDTSDFPLPLDTVVTYSCNLGYALNGSVNRTCMFMNDSATFEPEPPLCDPVCDDLPAVANGFITYSEVSIAPYNIGTVATYSCLQGYELRLGDETRTCVDIGFGGIFIGVTPTCENTPPPVCPTSTYLDGSDCSVQCPPGAIGNHRSGLCEALPTEFEILTNATAYFVNMATTTQLNSVVLNYSVFLNQSGINVPIISLSLQSPLYSQEILTFDNGEQSKSYIPPFLPEGYSVDDNDIATFKESILYRGEVPQAFYSEGQASLQLDLTSVVSLSEILLGETATTPMFVTIMQQEQGIQVAFEIPERTELETAGDVEVCAVVVEGVLAREAIVTVASRDGSALAGEDYEQFSVDLSFDPDTNRVCFTVTVTNDTRYELPESFDLVLTSSDDSVIINEPTSVFNINDDDVVVIGFPQEVYDVTEDIGDAPITVQIISGELADGVSVDIFFSNQNVTAFDGSDYTAMTRTLTFTSTITSIPVPVRIMDDMVYEDLEIFVATLSEASLDRMTVTPGAAIVNIADEDVITIGFVETDVTVSEGDGNTGLQVVVISGMLDAEIQVQVTTRDGSASSVNNADYSSVIQPLTLTTTTDVGDVSVLISEDGISELLENFFADLSLLTNTDRVTIAPAEATVTIEDNGVVRIGFEQEVYPAFENVTAMICVRLLPDSPSLDREVVVTIRSSDGTATAPADYIAIMEQLTFGPGVSRVCVEVLPVDDGLVEGPETFNVTLTSDDDVVLVPAVATVVIQELDMVFVMFERPTYTFTENGITGSVIVVKTGVTDQPFSVQVTGGPSTQTDVVISASGFNEVVTFEAGPDADNSITVQFTLTDDDVALEAIESYIGSLDIVGNPEGVILGMIDTTIVNVQDDDVVTVTFGRPELTVDEDVGNFTMCVTLDRVTLQPVTVTIEARDGSAISPGDFNAGSIPTSLTIPAGATSACFEGMIVDDTIDEDTESFTLVITGVTPGGGVIGGDTTVISITDNDAVCAELPAIANGEIAYSSADMPRPIGTVASYACNDGFNLDGPVSRTCVENAGSGMFDMTAPTCIPIECEELEPLANGVITYEPDTVAPYSLNTNANHVCNRGYRLVGTQVRVCEDVGATDGQFNQEAPICEEITCDDLPALDNAVISYSSAISPRPIDTVATYQCVDRYTLEGAVARICAEDGMFNGEEPRCVLIPLCVELEVIENGRVEYNDDPFSVGTVATYFCNSGYALVDGPDNKICIESEGGNVVFDPPQTPVCDPECDQIFVPSNAIVTYNTEPVPPFPAGALAMFECVDGFSPVTTSPGQPTTFPLPGELIFLECGEIIQGGGGVFVRNGTSSQVELNCTRDCVELPAITNGMISYSPDMTANYSAGTVATYTCDDGFGLVPGVGNSMRTCLPQMSGDDPRSEFDGAEPRCEPVCMELAVIPNGMISYSPDMTALYSVDTVATYTCNSGFRFVAGVGDQMRTCTETTESDSTVVSGAEFSGMAPSCEPVVVCAELAMITNGGIVYIDDMTAPYDVGTVAIYSCNPDFVLRGGNVVRFCVDAGDSSGVRFDGEAPTCQLLVIPPDAVTVGIESARVTVSESQNVVGVVIVKDPTPRDLLVTVRLDSITATGGVDYGPFSNPIIRLPALLPANDTRVPFFIPLMDDNIVENTETFRVGLESRDSSVIVVGIDSTIVSIEDDDVVEFTLSLRDGSPIVTEGNLQLTFNLNKEGVAIRNVDIVVRTQDGSTTGGGDYTILELPLTFAPSESLMEFTVDIRDDSIVETMEMFSVTFEPAVGETGVAPITTETVITIVDDNDFVSVGLVPPSPRLGEGATGLVQLESSGNNEIPVTVAIDVANFGTATVGLDFYLNVSNITFEPGVTSLFIPVVAVSDGLYEGEDESVILIGRPGDGETRVRVIPGSEQATFVLTDTDSVSVGFLMSVMTVSESSGPVDVAIGLVNGHLATDVVLRVDATGDLAEMDDFDFQSVELTFGPGQPNVSIVTIGIRDDSVFEGREGFSLSLTSDSPRVDFDPQILQVLIVDNEDLIVLFSSTVYTAQETDPSVEVRVQLGPGIQLQRDITLDLRTSDGAPPTGATGGLDFEPLNTTLIFGPGVTTATRTVMLLDDEISEGLENFEVQVVLVNEELGDPGVIVSARVLVFDNEDIFVSLSSMEYIVEEGRGLVVIAIDKSGITPGNQDTLVLLTLSDGTAIGGTVDYGPFPVATPTTLPALLLANDTRTLFGIPITNDNLVEGDESFFVALSIANELSRENGGIVFLGNLTMATVVITDNDVINVLLVVSGQEMGVVTIEEGGVAISLSAVRNDNVRLARNVTMVARTTAGTAQGFTDFLPATITLEFLAGVQMMDFSVFLLEDTVAEGNESFTVTLDSSDPGVVISSGTVEIIIVDNDVALVNFAQEIYDAFELDRSVEVCLTKSADTAIPVIISLVPIETVNPPDDAVPALATIDFDATPINVTFAPMATQACVRVSVFQDNLRGEGLEVFSLTLAGLEGQAAIIGRGDRSIVNVLLNDVPDVIVGIATLSPVAVVEGVGRVEVCVTVFNPAPSELLNTTLTVTIETISGTADNTDYTPVTAVLVLDNGLRSDCFQVRILDDDLFEDPVLEEFNLNILSVESTNLDFRVLTSPANVTVVIGDDDRSVTIGFSDVFYSVNESDSVRVCVAVTIPPPMKRFTQQEIVLLVSTLPGTANESDYMSFSDRVVGTVSNNNRETCFVVEVINDEIIEQSEETFSLVLSVEVPMDSDLSVSLDPSVAIVIITDDDEPPPPPTPTITTPTPTLGTTPTPTVTLGTTPTPTVIVGTTPTPTPIPTTTPTPVVRGNDTIVGDPLFSVPLNLVDGSELLELKTLLHLCYEIHGRPDTYFNLVSDECTNINAYYTGVVPDTTDSLGLNIITQIGVRAIDSQGNCVRVRIDSASNCTPVVMTSGGGVVSEIRYDRDGVIVSKVRNRVRVSVPNCGGNRLVMWVTCEAPGGMMRFDITRGVGLTPTSHGLLGQFWNVPVTIRKYTYTGGEELYLDVDQLYVVTVTHPTTGSTRRFIAEFGRQIWDLSNKDCLYAGNIQGGRLGDIDDASVSDSVVEGRYSQYVVDGLFDYDFDYFHFNADSCI